MVKNELKIHSLNRNIFKMEMMMITTKKGFEDKDEDEVMMEIIIPHLLKGMTILWEGCSRYGLCVID
ncbi:hypothetical protein RND71_041845 [Anisodus tanguticus]|uniref:Uncharacterized protein n=1 Tax=Anisodus tanguticus TaxID=243964 RepID=A0AAE1QWF3_9SOLA|nr:hypothetical protein RND71_041845 [Anisodus tanguticus]